MLDTVAGEADDTLDAMEDVRVGWDVLIEPSVEEHVADGGAHGHKVEAEERKIVISEMNIFWLSRISEANLKLNNLAFIEIKQFSFYRAEI